MQPAERGLDRAFRLLREDQVATMRGRLALAATPPADKQAFRAPRPPLFTDACFTQVGVWKQGDRPYLHVEFDLPARAARQFRQGPQLV